MEDLAGLNFSGNPSNQPKSAPPTQTRFPQSTNYISPTPSRANYHIGPTQSNGGTKSSAQRNLSPSTLKPDSFASLSAFSGIKGTQLSNASLEQQRLAKEKEKREALEKEKKNLDMHFGDNEFWEKHSRTATPIITTTDTSGDVDLAGFSSDAPVNTATHFPPPTEESSVKDAGQQDPFDMSGFAESFSRTRYHSSPGQIETTESSDDILGILAQPVETFAKPKSPSPKPELAPEQPAKEESSDDEASNERDKAIASIVEMGFTIGQATRALAQTPSGIDVEAAINSLVSRPSSSASARHERPHHANQRIQDFPQRHTPDPQSRPSSQPKGISQMAGEVGTSLLKGAGSLWKSGREKMNTFIQEWEGDVDASVPKWMADQQRHSPQPRPRRDDFTEEARVLDGPRDEVRRPRADPLERGSSSRSHNDRINLRKQVEEEAEMGYRSSARRRVPNRQTPVTQDIPSRTRTPPTKEIDLFSSEENSRPEQSSKPTSQRPSPSETPPIRTPPKPQVRQVPPTSESALSSSHSSRQKGSEAFKLGDYPLALTHYTSALTHLPSSHPQRIIILSNRAITNLKLGDAKAAVIDCNDLLTEVGPSEGENETIDDIEGPKNLREIWAKGIVRKATALEMQEKYADALESWKMAVNAGFGGTQALDGKRRCENALGIKSISNVPSRTATPSQISRPASAKPGPGKLSMPVRPNVNKTNFQKQSSATEDLARANAAAAADEDERLRLYDSVDGKVNAWQTGKESNLRALLSSLDLILWPEAGWKKVNMSELVVVTRVKIIYMKAIAKVHPDKISSSASVEQRMIAAAVFARLNDAWGVFKEQNNL